ncbi:glycerol dehydrogenase [Lacticaseibacillus paracasei NRIC 1981]|uniref:iron-containing alcohol dehydrogenase family protein n=1 Tax=Lacticaseibacillus paracasei TaxID=1597 RepID=UPI0005E1F32F|nr:iron-containing alcohol dehydrogenase family protein [Lacticaseibacillus paracasei]GAN40896.1 glycerol dehydrogenase [Lacticaseibacillus paracasei NRIC 1981]
MLQNLQVKIGPEFYCYSEGALDLIPKLLEEHSAKNVLVIHGTKSWEKAEPYLGKLENTKTLSTYYEKYHGECSFNEGKRIADICADKNIDFIIGVGGGKLCDLTMYTASIAHTKFATVPTLASNCAPWTPLAVMYKDNGLAEGKTVHINRQANFLVMDPRIIIDAPINYFVAGVADTLAKWYESDMILEEDQYKNEPMLQMARYAALMCKDKIMKEAEPAINDMKSGKMSDEFVHISEIVIAIAGLVGGFGDKYSRNTAAHTIHDALSAYLPQIHKFLHGEKVAYGIFFQLALENRYTTINELIPFYQKFHLPMSLKDLGVWPMNEDTMGKVLKLANGKKKIHLLPFEVTEASLKKAMFDLEDYMAKKEPFSPK